MATLTLIGIINLALDQSGVDSSYQTKARTWFNFITNTLSEQNNYKFYNTTATAVPFLTNVRTYPLPATFQKADTCYRLNPDGSMGTQIFIVESYDFDNYLRNVSGDPTLAYIDIGNQNIIFNNLPTSNTSTSYVLRYFRKPTQYAVDGSQDTVIPDFPDQNVLVQELIKMCFKDLDDERYQQQSSDALDAQRKLQRNQFQNEDTGKVDLSHANFVRRRWR